MARSVSLRHWIAAHEERDNKSDEQQEAGKSGKQTKLAESTYVIGLDIDKPAGK
jgi:hypothetical protein